MAYTGAGQLIEAWDYNRLTWGGNTTGTYTSTPSNLAYVWGVGNGAFGYGQDASAMTVVAVGGTVAATQWSTFVQRLNLALAHQSGTAAQLASGSNIGVVAGATIQYFANVATAVGTVNTNKASFNSTQGSTTTGANFDDAVSTSTGIAGVAYGTRTVTFASADAARYFFNAGGQLNYRVSTPTGAGSAAQNDFIGMINGLGGWNQLNTTSSGRTGTGQTLGTNSTTFGYRNNVLNTATSVVTITSTEVNYTADTAAIQVYTSSSDTTRGANGLNVIFRAIYTIADHSWDDAISVTHRSRVDIVYPETTYLSGTAWGTPVIT
jgi:hypothetical protein